MIRLMDFNSCWCDISGAFWIVSNTFCFLVDKDGVFPFPIDQDAPRFTSDKYIELSPEIVSMRLKYCGITPEELLTKVGEML